jgi:thymidylate synthase (FAD)
VIVVGSMISLGYYLRVIAAIWMREAPARASPGSQRRARCSPAGRPRPTRRHASLEVALWSPSRFAAATIFFGIVPSRCSTSRTTPRNPGEMLVEFGGRLCYRSWEPGLNANVTRVRTDRREYFENILRSAHGSVLEHANYSFALRNVSRVFTHELVRHRAGSAFSQESLRYVRLTDIGFRVPDVLEPVREQALQIVEQLEEFQRSAAEKLGLDEEGIPFHVKKEATSALRRLAPIGLSTDIIWTANARTLRHVIEMRTAEGAEEELRAVFDEIAQIARREAPLLFQDFERREDGSWMPTYRKV